MRCALLALAVLACAASATPALAVGPVTHGPDPVAIDAGREAPLTRAGQAGASATTWCGEERATDDRLHEVDNGVHRYHAVYAIPADAASRLRDNAPTMQADALRASALLERQYARAIRYDLGTSCGPQYLDITTVRLAQTTAELQRLAETPTGTLDAVTAALDAAGLPVIKRTDSARTAAALTRNWLVWLDGPAPAGACGQAMLYDDTTRDQSNLNNLGGKVAVVFRNEDGFCGSNSVRHEIAHNLGAVLDAAPNGDAGHCTDAVEDTMCNPEAPQVADGRYHALYFDYGNDDYWDPPAGPALPWWTVNLSRFICPDAACNYAATAAAGLESEGVEDDSSAAAGARLGRIRVATRRAGRGWRVTVRAQGRGTALLEVRCRRSGSRRMTTAWRARARLPRTVRRSVRCASRPKVRAVLDRRP